MSKIELKPCPFCGGPADYTGSEHAGYTVECKHCGAQSGWGDYGFQVESKWNARVPDPALAAKDATIARLESENERMREALEPFALVAEHDIGADEDNSDRFTPILGELNRAPKITVGHMRAARAALSPIPDPAGGMPVEVK